MESGWKTDDSGDVTPGAECAALEGCDEGAGVEVFYCGEGLGRGKVRGKVVGDGVVEC